ncbi:MAG: toprim domain-containing protein [Salinimicrobium sediminis]|nr:toprim domain-containing protein [Salinimicrobium sediminis]
MENNLLNWKEARQKSIIKVLSDFGFVPKRQTSKAAWYLSPLRTEKEASFCVTLNKNLWYDFGIGQGGNVIDLVIVLKSCSPREALRYLSSQSSFFFNPPEVEKSKRDEPLKIHHIKEIQHPALLQYLRSRSISVSTARNFCKEIWYRYNGRTHFSIGLLNSSGGWELRNKYSKNSTAPKSYSLISQQKEKLLIFEGMFDFLSLATMDKNLIAFSDSLVLNSLGFLNRSLPLMNNYQETYLYLDNDAAGKKAANEIKKLPLRIKDYSTTYSSFKDINEKLRLLPQRFKKL